MTAQNAYLILAPHFLNGFPHIHFRVPFVLRKRHEKEMADYEEKVHTLDSKLKKTRSELDDAIRYAEIARAEADAGISLAESECDRVSEIEEIFKMQAEELKTANANIAILEGRIACLQPERRQFAIEQAAKARMVMTSLPTSASDVLKYFQNAFPDRICFTDESFRLAKNCTIPIDELYKCLFNIATVLTNLFRAHSCTPFEVFEDQTGIHVSRGYGSMTHKDNGYHNQFVAHLPDGRTIDTEAHITWSKLGQTITFGYDRVTDTLVVDRVGVHPEIFTTKHNGH